MLTVEAWGDRFPPACKCGCGEPVRFRSNKPNVYVNRAHYYWDRNYRGGHPHGPVIEKEKFRTAITTIRNEKGWSLAETARRGGWSTNHLKAVLYGDGKYVLEKTVRLFLRRLAGLPTEMSARQKREWEVKREHDRRVRSELQGYFR